MIDLKPVSDIFSSMWGGLDELFTSEEERLKAKAILINAQAQFEAIVQGELSNRHQADMASDSKLAKNIRPFTLLSVVVMYAVLAFMNMFFDYAIDPILIELLQTWGTIIFGFYFGSRGIEKITSMAGSALIGRVKK